MALHAVAVAFAALLFVASLANCQPTKAERKLLEYAKEKGAQMAMTVGRECPSCVRGMVATRDVEEGELLLELPIDLAIRLEDLGRDGFASEYAYFLLRRMHSDPEFNKTYGLYLDTLPTLDDVLSAELFTDELLSMVQSPVLEDLIKGQREIAEQVYHGTYPQANYTPLAEVLGPGAVTLEQFKHYSALIGTRDFGLSGLVPTATGDPSTQTFLVPVADLVNTNNDPNAQRSDNGTHMLMTASRPIKKGEEVTNNYQPHVIHRPDMSLHIYGFVDSKEPLLLPATDLPDYKHENAFAHTRLDDATYYGPDGEYNAERERDRLMELLEDMPTSVEEDEALLEGRSGWLGWKERAVVEFRLARKRVLWRSIVLIEEEMRAVREAADVDSDAYWDEETAAEL